MDLTSSNIIATVQFKSLVTNFLSINQ